LFYFLIVCFFFQAEDGIRDTSVTGVQTCALPIYFADVRITEAWTNSLQGEFVALAENEAEKEDSKKLA